MDTFNAILGVRTAQMIRKIRIMRRKFFFVILVLAFCSILTISIRGIDTFLYRQGSPYWLDMSRVRKNGSMKTTVTNTNRTRAALHSMKYNVINNDTVKLPVLIPTGEYKEKIFKIPISSPLNDFQKYPCLTGLPLFPKETWETDGKCVRTVNTTETGNATKKYCVPLKSLRGTTPICIYPAKNDIWVSGSIQKYGSWEGDLVARLGQLFKSHPDFEFLDIGCNIGAYSVSIAHQGTRVTAIDAMTQNLELLSHSLTLGNLHENVTLIWNAVSNAHNLIKFKPDKNNVGGTRIENFIFSPSIHSDVDLGRAITLDDLLPLFKGKSIVIKMDIEETEYNALLGGQRFLNEVNIIAIQMEFMWHRKGQDGPKILEFLLSKGFRPYKDLSKNVHLNSSNMSTWPGDIYFMKP